MVRKLALDLDGVGVSAKDAFEAASWLDGEWNSSAKAVAADLVEWKCRTWGSGRGRGYWSEVATFGLVATLFGLTTTRDYDGRDELIVMVPLDLLPQIAVLLERIGDDPEQWPWRSEEDVDVALEVAARVLGMAIKELEENEDLQEALHLC